MSYHPFPAVVPAVLLDTEPVVGGAQLAEGLQRRTRQCCRGLPSAPLLQLLDEQLRKQRQASTHASGNISNGELLHRVWNTWGLFLTQAKSRDDIFVDLVLVL